MLRFCYLASHKNSSIKADFYGVEGWLADLEAERTRPYEQARPLYDVNYLNNLINCLKMVGWKIVITTWLAKGGSKEYNDRTRKAKLEWLEKHLPSVKWDRVTIVDYGTPKENYCENPLDILFDDEEHNRNNWNGIAYDVNDILEVLKAL